MCKYSLFYINISFYASFCSILLIYSSPTVSHLGENRIVARYPKSNIIIRNSLSVSLFSYSLNIIQFK